MTFKSTLKALKRPQKALKSDLLSSASWAKLLFCFCFSVCSFESHLQCGHLLALIKNSVKCLIIKKYCFLTDRTALNLGSRSLIIFVFYPPSFYMQLVHKPHLRTRILFFLPFGQSNGPYLQPSKSSHDPVVLMKFEFCTHSARLLRKLDHVLLWILRNNTGLWQCSIETSKENFNV